MPLRSRDWTKVRYDVDCNGDGIAETERRFVDLDGDNKDEALVSIRCNESTTDGNGAVAGAYLLLYDGRSPAGAPRLLDTLGDEPDEEVGDYFVEEGQLIVTTNGYSSDEVARCCPDVVVSSVYEMQKKRLVLISREEIPQ